MRVFKAYTSGQGQESRETVFSDLGEHGSRDDIHQRTFLHVQCDTPVRVQLVPPLELVHKSDASPE